MKIKRNLKWSKLLGIFASVTTLAAVPILTTACGQDKYDAVFVTDEGVVTDQSFNQSGYEALKEYSKDHKGFKVANVQPTEKSTAAFQRAYNVTNQYLTGPRIAVLSGFLHSSKQFGGLGDIFNYAPKHDKNWYIGIDFSNPDPKHIITPPNFTSIVFNAVQSGILSAIWTGIYFNTIGANKLPLSPNDTINVATFGGGVLPTVTSYMDGLQIGVKYFNAYKGKLQHKMKMIYANNKSPSMEDFTGSFLPSEPKTKPLVKQLYKNGANVILPVAGPQAETALSLADPSAHHWIYGIDTDMASNSRYSHQKNKILGSAVKNITGATYKAIDYIKKGNIDGLKMFKKPLNYEEKDKSKKPFVGFIQNKQYANEDQEKTIEANYVWTQLVKDPSFKNVSADYVGKTGKHFNPNFDLIPNKTFGYFSHKK